MTAQAEGYSLAGNYQDDFVEGLARNYYQPFVACASGLATCTENTLYKFMSGYQPWWDGSKKSFERAHYLASKLGMDVSRDILNSDIADILYLQKARSMGWTSGMEGDQPWQWHNYWRPSREGEAIGWVWAPNRYGDYFWIMTADQTDYFKKYIKPYGAPPESE